MAGGEGSRLRPLTSNAPKPMLPLANKPMMEHIVELLERGWGSQLLLSQDVCHNSQLKAQGGFGYTYLQQHFLPTLRTAAVGEGEVSLTKFSYRCVTGVRAPVPAGPTAYPDPSASGLLARPLPPLAPDRWGPGGAGRGAATEYYRGTPAPAPDDDGPPRRTL